MGPCMSFGNLISRGPKFSFPKAQFLWSERLTDRALIIQISLNVKVIGSIQPTPVSKVAVLFNITITTIFIIIRCIITTIRQLQTQNFHKISGYIQITAQTTGLYQVCNDLAVQSIFLNDVMHFQGLSRHASLKATLKLSQNHLPPGTWRHLWMTKVCLWCVSFFVAKFLLQLSFLPNKSEEPLCELFSVRNILFDRCLYHSNIRQLLRPLFNSVRDFADQGLWWILLRYLRRRSLGLESRRSHGAPTTHSKRSRVQLVESRLPQDVHLPGWWRCLQSLLFDGRPAWNSPLRLYDDRPEQPERDFPIWEKRNAASSLCSGARHTPRTTQLPWPHQLHPITRQQFRSSRET